MARELRMAPQRAGMVRHPRTGWCCLLGVIFATYGLLAAASAQEAAPSKLDDAAKTPPPATAAPAVPAVPSKPVADAESSPAPTVEPKTVPAAADRPVRHLGVLIRFEGTITPLNEHYLYRKLEVARGMGADLVVIEIDSPGGMLDPSLKIAAHLRDIQWARTVAYIPREALSGGAIVALGCDEIIMHPQAKIGDAGPIYMNEGGLFEHAPEKIRTHLARHVRDLAESKGRSPALAEAMVDKDLIVFQCRNKADGQERFLSEHEISATARPGDWERIAPVLETQGGNFLEVSGLRAKELGIASAVAEDREVLRRQLHVESPWFVIEPSAKDTAVFVLNLPLVTGIILVIGLVALFIELSTPGIGLGGLVSFLCFALFFWSRFLGGTSGWLELTLFIAGAVFLAVELFLIPGFGVAGITGILLMVVSVVMASQEFVLPHTHGQLVVFARSVVVLVGAIVGFLAVSSVLSRHLQTIPIFRRLILTGPQDVAATDGSGKKWLDPQGKPIADPAATAGSTVFVGDWGVAQTVLRPAGRARFGAILIDVVADNSFIDAGKQVRVVEVQGNRVVVTELPA